MEEWNKAPSNKAENNVDIGVHEKLVSKMRQIADTAAPEVRFSDEDVERAASLVIAESDRAGEPVTLELIDSPEFETRLKAALNLRGQVRDAGTEKVPVFDASGALIKNVENTVDMRNVADEQKGAGGDAQVLSGQ